MSQADTWMPLYIGDYLADTGHLTTLEHGAYLLLIMHYWRNGPLPDDDKKLAAIARLPRKEWVSGVSDSVRSFFRVEDGALHHKRIDTERDRAKHNSDKRRAAAQARWEQKQSKQDANACPNADANASDMQSERNDPRAQLPSPSPRKKDSGLRPDADASDPPPHDPTPTPAERPIRDALWSDGLAALRRLTGQGEAKSRSLLGKLCKTAGDDCARVMSALSEAESLRPGDPVAWLTAAVGAKARDDPWGWINETTQPAPAEPFDLELTPDEHGSYAIPSG